VNLTFLSEFECLKRWRLSERRRSLRNSILRVASPSRHPIRISNNFPQRGLPPARDRTDRSRPRRLLTLTDLADVVCRIRQYWLAWAFCCRWGSCWSTSCYRNHRFHWSRRFVCYDTPLHVNPGDHEPAPAAAEVAAARRFTRRRAWAAAAADDSRGSWSKEKLRLLEDPLRRLRAFFLFFSFSSISSYPERRETFKSQHQQQHLLSMSSVCGQCDSAADNGVGLPAGIGDQRDRLLGDRPGLMSPIQYSHSEPGSCSVGFTLSFGAMFQQNLGECTASSLTSACSKKSQSLVSSNHYDFATIEIIKDYQLMLIVVFLLLVDVGILTALA
uniref:Uncharacterized protein n=1 Tax=Macrostomum lignano TaxID=282301 RepID=A0A1I8FP97_9PLAT